MLSNVTCFVSNILGLDLVDLGVTCDYGPKTMNFLSKWWAFLLCNYYYFFLFQEIL